MIAPTRERSATRALVLGLLALPFGIFAPFAIWAGISSLRRIHASAGALRGEASAVGEVAVRGAFSDRSVTSNSDGSRLVSATPSGGVFWIAVATGPLNLTGC